MKINNKMILIVLLLLLLAGCAEQAPTAAKDIISKSTDFGEYFKSSWFNGIFIYPFAQLINYTSPYIGVTLAVGLATLVVNLITLPLTLGSTQMTTKMQMIQPEINKIEKKYEGMTDTASKNRKAQETMALYQKHDIKMGKALIGQFLTFPIIIAFFSVVRRTEAIINGTVFGVSIQTTIRDGFAQRSIPIIIIFILMAAAQYLSINFPKYYAKYKLKKERRIKHYDESQNKTAGAQNQMGFMIVIILAMAFFWPAAMSVYWFFSSVMNIVKTVISTQLSSKHEAR